MTRAHEEYQDIVSRAIFNRANELGYNVVVFSSFVGYGEIKYEVGESEIGRASCRERV